MANIRECYCCSSKYEYCTRCEQYANQPKWRFMYDEESCKELFNAVSGYKMGVAKKENIKAVLDKYSITDYSKYKDSIKELLNELYPIKKANTKAKETTVKVVEETTKTEKMAVETVEETVENVAVADVEPVKEIDEEKNVDIELEESSKKTSVKRTKRSKN